MEFIKAAALGGLLSGVISLVIGSQGSRGGHLAIRMIEAGQYDLYWSWPAFFAGTGLAWALLIMQR